MFFQEIHHGSSSIYHLIRLENKYYRKNVHKIFLKTLENNKIWLKKL